MALTEVNSEGIKDGSIKNADIKSDAAIAKTKLAALDIVDADVNASAAIAGSKLAAATTSAAGSMSAADKTKLDAIEASADVTDATNVNAAGAMMNTDIVTKGHILVGDGAGDPTAVSVGTDTYVLTADSSTGTGVTWSAPAVTYDDTAVKNQIAMLAFYRATDQSKAKYNLVDQVIDGFHDTTGIDAGNSTNESHDNTNKLYKGESVAYATGGTINTYTVGGTEYKSHTFLADGTFTPPSSGTIAHMLVAGGAGGGTYGGGGAGGMLVTTSESVTAQGYTIDIGNGGGQGQAGQNTTGFGKTATGGGEGGNATNGGAANGGSGGGAGTGCGSSFWCSNKGSGTAGQGNNGGNGYDHFLNDAPYKAGGGGGGAGAVGSNANTTNGGAGGAGAQNDYRTGSNIYYAGGGGGAGNDWQGGNSTAGAGGTGGGGAGAAHSGSSQSSGQDGTANTGGGGGADPTSGDRGEGGSGIAVIRYPSNTFTGSGGDLTLQSVATTAQASPSKTDIVIMIEDGHGTATINTDLKAYTSKDGSTFTEHTLVDEGTWGATAKRVFAAHDQTPGGSSGTSMKWKITTHNQSAGSKETYIHGVSLGWH